MFDPISTYRIQFNKQFTFKDFDAIIPYLHNLGIKTIYASPIYEAVPGSMHGYDVVNPNRINPEIGDLEELRVISKKLKMLNMGWIQDIVPNHMGFHHSNKWLMDVLRNGENSPYRHFFDLVTKDLNAEPLMAPFLGDHLDIVIEHKELESIDIEGESFIKYYDSLWPIRDDSNDLKKQYYRLCSHEEANERINYRRFFTVNSLICLNIQKQDVFDEYHRFTKSLLEEDVIQGLRIDHIDGLFDPTMYLQRLRTLCGEEVYIVVEKILESGETLPINWPVQGTTGYDFLGLVNQLHTNGKAEERFEAFYKDLSAVSKSVYEETATKKRTYLQKYMQGELNNLCEMINGLNLLEDLDGKEEDLKALKYVIGEFLVQCPVYRFYSNSYPLIPEEAKVIDKILKKIEKGERASKATKLFRRIILEAQDISSDYQERAIQFYQRLMQFSGPLMAKGVEDTLMYTYNRFIGNNEVGDSPGMFGIDAADFHEQIIKREKCWRHALNTTATHDTKRGEDARARLAVLTDLKKEWIHQVERWRDTNANLKSDGSPDANDEYFIYQTLVATSPESDLAEDNYESRLLDYVEKALRESKRNSKWEEPDLEYESITKNFIRGLLDQRRDFWQSFLSFQQKVAAFGRTVSLSSLILKHLLPGIPDTYQGTEIWDLSMVDPDNRRPVDYGMLADMLSVSPKSPVELKELFKKGANGQIKQYVLSQLLHLRKSNELLFSEGLYYPLEVKGRHANHVFAFARRHKCKWLLCILPINLASLSSDNIVDGGIVDWEDTRVLIPEGLPSGYVNVLSSISQHLHPKTSDLMLSKLFSDFPASILLFHQEEQKRGTGILMHISSLPSAYGIGDFGPEAFRFLHFLAENGLKYWQLLPLNPLAKDQMYSPYSSPSVMAGNTLFISPEMLCEEKLLSKKDLKAYKKRVKRNVSYAKVSILKNDLLSTAYRSWLVRFPNGSFEFNQFCKKEATWLNDYALFELIKALSNDKPWMNWSKKYRDRDQELLSDLSFSHAPKLNEIKWKQFVFFQQWQKLRCGAQALGIQVIGDMPFYTALDSADVWANKSLFSLNKNCMPKRVAGVPPDYFNDEGQLWGMPVYDWEALAKNGFAWWVERVRTNFNMYDLLRMDHFRAFSAYWEVEAADQSAKFGKWKPGPGAAFFKSLFSELGKLQLIAEDLGEISADVYKLRDGFELPGMKVLQFAFGTDIADSVHIPHNFKGPNCIVYTATHDNNTTRGWYETEIDKESKKRIENYVGSSLTKKNVSGHMIRLALGSTADIAIIPIQDLLNKPAKHRMNTPASLAHNWTWRLKERELEPEVGVKIRNLIRLYGR